MSCSDYSWEGSTEFGDEMTMETYLRLRHTMDPAHSFGMARPFGDRAGQYSVRINQQWRRAA